MFNGPYIDDWLLLNLTLKNENIEKSNISLENNQLFIEGSIDAIISFGKFYEILIH